MRPKFWFFHWLGGYLQARDLAEGLNGRIILRKNSQYEFQPGDIVINWGSSVRPEVLEGVRVLNKFERVGHGKLANWQQLLLAGIKIPEHTASRREAERWKGKVVARSRDHGMGGEGIDIYESGADLARSNKQYKFYVKYVKKERELRYHVFNGKVIFVQEKLRKRDNDNVDPYIRSHGRGWCFAFKHFDEKPAPAGGEDIAVASIAALGLDFGAVDMGWSDRSGFTVFEVNSAPGIENTSLKAYVETINALL